MNITFIAQYCSCIFTSCIWTAQWAVISLSCRPQTSWILMSQWAVISLSCRPKTSWILMSQWAVISPSYRPQTSWILMLQGAVIRLSYRPQTSWILMLQGAVIRLSYSEQTTTLPVRACVTGSMGDFMLGNSRSKLPDINYVGTCLFDRYAVSCIPTDCIN